MQVTVTALKGARVGSFQLLFRRVGVFVNVITANTDVELLASAVLLH